MARDLSKPVAKVIDDLRWRSETFLGIECDTDDLQILLAWVDRAAEVLRKVSAHAETFDAYPAPPADETPILITAGLKQDECTVLRARDARQARDLLAELEGRNG